jgi:hypothetical protein
MSHSSRSVLPRKRRSSRPSRGSSRPPQRSRPVISLALVVIAAGVIATGTYFATRDDVFTRLIDRQTKISSEDQIADLRAQLDRLTSRLDWDWVRAAKLEQLTNDQSTQARNGWPAGTIDSAPLPSNMETPSEPIVAIAQTTEHAIIKKKKSHPSNRRYARVIPTRTQEAPTVAGGNHAYAEPVQAGQQNYY